MKWNDIYSLFSPRTHQPWIYIHFLFLFLSRKNEKPRLHKYLIFI